MSTNLKATVVANNNVHDGQQQLYKAGQNAHVNGNVQANVHANANVNGVHAGNYAGINQNVNGNVQNQGNAHMVNGNPNGQPHAQMNGQVNGNVNGNLNGQAHAGANGQPQNYNNNNNNFTPGHTDQGHTAVQMNNNPNQPANHNQGQAHPNNVKANQPAQGQSSGKLIILYMLIWMSNLTGAIISILCITKASDVYGDNFDSYFARPSSLSIQFNMMMLYDPLSWLAFLLTGYLCGVSCFNAFSIGISQIIGLILQMITTAIGIWNYTQFDSVTRCDIDSDVCTLNNYVASYLDSILIITIVPLVLILITQAIVSTQKSSGNGSNPNEHKDLVSQRNHDGFDPSDPFASIYPPSAPPAPDADVNNKLAQSQHLQAGNNANQSVATGSANPQMNASHVNNAGNNSTYMGASMHNGSQANLKGGDKSKPIDLNDIEVNNKSRGQTQVEFANQYQQSSPMKSSIKQSNDGPKKSTTFEEHYSKQNYSSLASKPPMINAPDPYADNILEQVQKMVSSQVQGLIQSKQTKV